MVILCLLVSVEEDAPRRKSATILCWMEQAELSPFGDLKDLMIFAPKRGQNCGLFLRL
jgi:hypothetical protein